MKDNNNLEEIKKIEERILKIIINENNKERL